MQYNRNMKKPLILFALLVLLTQAAFSQTTWTVQTVPNTRLQGDNIHVADPDGYLSDSAEWAINTALGSIRSQADVFLVCLSSIDSNEPKRFATTLFNNWGIGDADTDNGVLLLFVEDQHALEFETGYGAEATLTDTQCERIFRTAIVPRFRAGDYEGGLCAGVGEIVKVYGGELPDGLASVIPAVGNDHEGSQGVNEEDMSDYAMLTLGLMFVIICVSLFRGSVKQLSKKLATEQEETLATQHVDGIDYITGYNARWSGHVWEKSGCMMSLVYGIVLIVLLGVFMTLVPIWFPKATEKVQNNWMALFTTVAYLTWICIVQNRKALKQADKKAATSKSPKSIYEIAKKDAKTSLTRIIAPWIGVYYAKKFKKRINESAAFCCPTCGGPMEPDEHFPLPEIRCFEEKIGAYKHTAYRCASGHEFVYQQHGPHFDSFVDCPECSAHAGKMVSEKLIEHASYQKEGLKEVTYCCQHCNKEFVRSKVIPIRVKPTTITSSSGSYRSSSHSSYRSSGSFGGGRSGGGGFSGRW